MFPKINPTTTAAWQALSEHASDMKQIHMRDLFQQDKERFSKWSFTFNDLLVDFSKNIVTDETKQLLLNLAEECRLKEAMEAMFNGDAINETEQRAVLHVALRNLSGNPVYTEGRNVMDDVNRVREQMRTFCKKVHQGGVAGLHGKKRSVIS